MQSTGSRAKAYKCRRFGEGAAVPLVTIMRDVFGLTLDDSLNFVKHVTKISTEESWKAARCSL